MNEAILHGKWRKLRGAMQEEWGRLTDDDFRMMIGRKDRLIGALEERYGYTHERASQEVENFLDRYGVRRRSVWQRAQRNALHAFRRRPFAAIGVAAGIIVMASIFLRYQRRDADDAPTTEV